MSARKRDRATLADKSEDDVNPAPQKKKAGTSSSSTGAITGKDATEGSSPPPPPLLIVKWENRRLAIRRHPEYADVISAVKNSQSMDTLQTRPFYLTSIIPGTTEEVCEISEEIWPLVSATLPSVTVELKEIAVVNVPDPAPSHSPPPQQAPSQDDPNKLKITVRIGDKRSVQFTCRPSAKVEALARALESREGYCETTLVLFSDGERMQNDRTLESYDLQSGDLIEARREQVGGKPIIYVMSPHPMQNVSVGLTLVPAWSFSAVYPNAEVESGDFGERIQWVVDTTEDGTLRDKATGLLASYLFWEAKTHPAAPLTPSSSRPSSPNNCELVRFDPSRPTISPKDAVLLGIDKIPVYLDRALEVLTLHTEARTSSITYWLPSLLKHQYIALQFLPQKAYEAGAPIDVSPAPAVVTRVFMLFRGVQGEDLDAWDEAHLRADQDVSFWTDVVGINVERASDAGLYRVLEWGGMEIQ